MEKFIHNNRTRFGILFINKNQLFKELANKRSNLGSKDFDFYGLF